MQTTFNVKLGGLAPDAADDQVDQMWKISRKAQQIVQRELERRLYVAHGVAPIHGLPTMVGGSDPDEFRKNGAWSVTVQMAADTPTETLAELRDLIVNAHKEAAGKSGVSVTFEGTVSRVERFFLEESRVAFPDEPASTTEPPIERRQLKEQFITFFVILGELSADAPASDYEAMNRIHEQAYRLVESGHRRLSTYRTTTGEPDLTEIPAYELGADADPTEVFEEKVAWPISVAASTAVPAEAIDELRELVVRAYQGAAASTNTSVRMVHAERHDVFIVRETTAIPFHQVESTTL